MNEGHTVFRRLAGTTGAIITTIAWPYFWVVVSGVIIAAAGLLAGILGWEIEHGFVLAAGVSNLVALNELCRSVFTREDRCRRAWLIGELLFFCFFTGADFHLAFGRWPTFLHIVAFACVLAAMLYLAVTPDPKKNVGIVVYLLLFPLFLLLIPELIRRLRPDWTCRWGGLIVDRGYAWLHLLAIPLVYLLVDSQIAKIDSAWSKFIALDKSLFYVGVACAFSGFCYAALGRETRPEPLFETGAAAVMLLVGNSWYLTVEQERQEDINASSAST